jgi:hypothetical protein
MTPEKKLQKRIYATYFWVRRGLVLFGFALPLILLGIGWWNQIHLQSSMSAYYFAFNPPDSQLRVFPGRAVFVGILFVGGILLMFYRGFSNTENWALNIAGLAAVVAALVPMAPPDYCTNCGSNTFSIVHEVAGIVLFLCMAFVAWACVDETLVHLPEHEQKWFRMGYYALAILLILLPAAVLFIAYKFGRSDYRLFYAEWAAMWTFAAYWGLKTIELSMSNLIGSNLEEAALKGEMPIRPLKKEPNLRERASRLVG